jgi:hypothetical protein
MTQHADMPPFEIISAEDASTNTVKRLRVYASIPPEAAAPEASDGLAQVAARVVAALIGTNDVMVIFFHPDAAAAGKRPAVARAQFIRDGVKRGVSLLPRRAEWRMGRFKTPHGLITIETPEPPEAQPDGASDAVA